MAVRRKILTNIGLEPSSELDLAKMTESGLALKTISVLEEHGVTSSEVSNIVISRRTLKHRKSRNEKLSKEETNRPIRVARIISQAEAVFGSRGKALLWLRTPNDLLYNGAPLEMLTTESGGRLVESILGQIDEGIQT